jgi:acetylornithine deacetylase/succinyl-diaminopimelate desuccinylase-like protein
MPVRPAILLAVSVLTFSAVARAQSPLTPYQQLGRDLLRELIETNTTYSSGSTTAAANALATRFRAAGFPSEDVRIIGPDSGRDAKNANLVVRFRGRGARRPVLLISHLDVVEAKRDDWALDPFTLTERDGHFYGRGTLDVKDGDAALVAALLRMKQEGIVPAGDYILALTAGEEMGGGYVGAQWLIANHHDLIDADYAINPDAGGGEMRGDKHIALDVQAAEKVFQTFRLTVRSPGGHSSVPEKDNAIYRLSAALLRLGAYEFPFETNAITRTYFTRTAPLSSSTIAADMIAVGANSVPDHAAAARLAAHSPYLNALLRTTCVATMIDGGHAVNALPQRVAATVNCRLMPGTDPTVVERTIRTVLGDTTVVVTRYDSAKASPPSILPARLERTIREVTASTWGPLPIIPSMDTGASDGLYLRNAGMPVYGITGMFVDPNVPADIRAHGLDERIGVKAFYDQLEFTYRLLKAL